jgi:EAL domain-containing protein (putative c-di-GMP-specific phosphodiesterase class I)/GGDEF domain-containing protein
LQDSFGFQLSERLLRTIGKRVEHIAARWGGAQALAYHLDGDGFAVLLPQQLDDDRPRFEDDFIGAITDPIVIDDHEILVSTAVGHYALPRKLTQNGGATAPTNAETVLQRLRRTVASAKGFHNAVRRYSAEVHDAVEATQELVQEMRHAVRNRSFRLEYQPILDRTGNVVAAEALIRWEYAPPSVFIPLAEQSGLIVPITEFVVEQVAEDTAELRQMLPEIEVHINISARHIVQLQILELLTRSLAHHGVPHSAIGLEITETSFVHGGSTFTEILQSLRAAGFGVAIDDFGTGYSSLSYLKQIPADRIKIDQSFVAGLPVSSEDGALVESVITLGRRLGKTIVAEGIESDLQHQYLVERGVDFLQGFTSLDPYRSNVLWTRPAPAPGTLSSSLITLLQPRPPLP